MSESAADHAPPAFAMALQSLTSWFAETGIPYTTLGGIAVSLTAQPRATQDIDVVIWLDQEHWQSFLVSGERHGFQPRIAGVLDFAGRSRVLLMTHSTGISVDISCGALPFEREMIERARTLDLGEVTLRVPTPEDLIITKAVAQRPKDLIDIEAILEASPNLDLARIRRWVREFAEALEMPELLTNVERLLSHR